MSSTESPKLKGILGGPSQSLLTVYGKPTAIYFLEGADSSRLSVPDGVTLLSSKTLPAWAQPVAFPMQGRAQSVVWLYRSNDRIASYLIDPLGYVESACIVRHGTLSTSKNERFEVSTLPNIFLGEQVQAVLERYGSPTHIRSISFEFAEWIYYPKAPPKRHKEAFATIFTLRDNQVVRVSSFPGIFKAPGALPFDKLPETRRGRFFLLKPS